MPRLANLLATVGGLGVLPYAPGTLGSAVGLLVGLLWLSYESVAVRWGVLALGVLIGVLASTSVERQLETHDPPCVVIDEVIGMLAIAVAVPSISHSFWLFAIAFGLFRLFDVLKPPPLRWLSRFPAGWGIMLDDLGASAYTCLVLWLILRVATWPGG